MVDPFGRTLDYLRVSVTDRCNLRCVYCMPPSGVESKPHDSILRFEETLRLCTIFASLGIRRIKVTGGEPLVRRGIAPFIQSLKDLPGIERVSLTTNGLLLNSYLDEGAGIPDAVNISLDTLDRERFKKITLHDGLDVVLKAIENTLEKSIPLKINCVPIRGLNEADLVPLAALAKEKNIAVRFIELMPIGYSGGLEPVPGSEVYRLLENAFGPLRPFTGIPGGGPARYYSADGFTGKIGFISPLSHGFCETCNRLRLSSEGVLKPCLSSDLGKDLRGPLRAGASDEELIRAIRGLVSQKPKSHNFLSFCNAPPAEHTSGMFRIGG
jgi:cyclic pyranopterin phosphate synthase